MAEFTTTFNIGDYIRNTYNFDPTPSIVAKIPGDMAYNGILIATKNESGKGQMKSYIKVDQGIPFNESLAYKFIEDPKVNVKTKIYKNDNGQPATEYILVFENPMSSIFRPTATIAPSDCLNVHTDFEVEMLFTFEDEYLIPIRKKVGTHGPGAYKLIHVINDMYEALDSGDAEEIIDFFERCQGVKVSEQDGNAILEFMASTTEGAIEAFHLELDRDNIRELIRSLVSVRLISCEQTIDGE